MYDSMGTFLFYVFLRVTDFRLEYDVNTGAKVIKQYGKRCLRVEQDEVYLRAKKG